MANFKEIVTKAVIGKTKKSTKEELTITTDSTIDNVLGCWVINHTFSGASHNGKVTINGSYDINVWYAYDSNTKTNVIVRNFNYKDAVNVNLNNSGTLDNSNEIIVRSLSAPSVTDVKTVGNAIKLNVVKELGVEIVGDMKVRIAVEDDYDDYEDDDTEIPETVTTETIEKIEIDVNEDYLSGVNQL